MYIKNLSNIIQNKIPIETKYTTGSLISGRVVSIDEGKGNIKLIDGTIIPVIFQNENNLDKNKYIRFRIEKIKGNLLILRALNIPEDQNENSSSRIDDIFSSLNIRLEEGREIINSLIKFNLPATDENILILYKNNSCLKSLKQYSDSDILRFLEQNVPEGSKNTEKYLEVAKDVFNTFKEIDLDFLSFLLENDIPVNLEGMIKSANFLKGDNDAELVSLIKNLTGNIDLNLESESNFNIIGLTGKEISILKERLEIIDMLKSMVSSEKIQKFMDDLSFLKSLKSNYGIYFFNSYHSGYNFKNSIIIKNNRSKSGFIDSNNSKAFISLQTPNLGAVECYIIKRNKDICLNFKVAEEHLNLFRENLPVLKKILNVKNFNLSCSSVDKISKRENLVNLSIFFNNIKPLELDVKV